ncbi:hypothetical protein AAU61_05605 [Desulfocarbo indianensis]|nr:hypothetical protein AAU61_05605 [Desulfocarbo indianensis]
MPSGGYEDMGPKIDLDAQPDEPSYMRQDYREPLRSPDREPAPSGAYRREASGGGKGLALASLAISLLALLIALWGLWSQPDMVSGPPLSPEVVPGGAAERVAKLEKDVSQLMLRLVTQEKELQSLANKAGTVTQLTELNAKVAALQDRLDARAVDERVSSLARKREQEPAPRAEQKPAPRAAEPQAKPEPARSERKKQTYTVRRGDTLFTVAQRYKVRMSDLMSWNKIKKGDVLKVGDKLVIYK